MAEKGVRRGRRPNAVKPRKVNPSLPAESYACLERLVGLGYGGNPTEVAKFLILREVDDLKRAGVLKPIETPNAQEEDQGDPG
jgi:hypothetical protein